MNQYDLLMTAAAMKDAEDEAVQDQLMNYAQDVSVLYQQLKVENKKLLEANQRLEEAYYEIILTGFDLISLNNKFLGSHCKRVSFFAEKIANELLLDKQRVLDLKFASLIHDIGLTGIPAKDLEEMFAGGPKSELDTYRNHPMVVLRPESFNSKFRKIADIIRAHHENIDGSGFPRGLDKEQIPVESRIIAIADDYDRFKSVRGNFADSHEIIDMMNARAGNRYDREIFRAFEYMITLNDPFREIQNIGPDMDFTV